MSEIRTLSLPKRYEALEREASQSGYDITAIVHRIDDAASRIETLLRQVNIGGLGRFELFLGRSGSGKTTFFKTLTKFFTGTTVNTIPHDISLRDVKNYIEQRTNELGDRQVWVMYERDNQSLTKDEAFEFLEDLRVLFRQHNGKVVICWPLTHEPTARLLSDTAWSVGRDSLVDIGTKGIYTFNGPSKTDYKNIADLTTRTITGDGLEAFGISDTDLSTIISESETISEFFSRTELKASEIAGHYRDLLKEKPVPSVWILVSGDDSKDLNLTVASLTQGTQKSIDIDRVVKFLDDPNLDAAYLKEWKKRRSKVAFLLRLFDVRLFELPPNVALACIRAFGDAETRKLLKLQSVSARSAIDTISRSALFRALAKEEYGANAYLRATDDETKHEYIRIQASAKSGDKKLNKALAEGVQKYLESKSLPATVTAEKQNTDDNLKPDIKIIQADGKIICLEPTWRSTGSAVPSEIPEKQNTLTVGHIQKYLLEKMLSYVNEYDF
ncbi:hypothetical protein [Pseudomonas sp. USHLN015]|uniref:hypothetical protein n=1 Tax=Pseudomonas sp. USHLN015 TaxID=3081296 RepID=UPI00301D199F